MILKIIRAFEWEPFKTPKNSIQGFLKRFSRSKTKLLKFLNPAVVSTKVNTTNPR